MNEENTKKKQYPSQMASRTISARVPVQDYVAFLNESLSKGISLNDFLLLKIYNQYENENNDENIITISFDDILRHEREDDAADPLLNSKKLWQYFLEYRNNFYDENEKIFRLNKEAIIGFINQSFYHKIFSDSKMKNANITDVKVQINRLVKEKLHKSEQLQFLREITELLNELE